MIAFQTHKGLHGGASGIDARKYGLVIVTVLIFFLLLGLPNHPPSQWDVPHRSSEKHTVDGAIHNRTLGVGSLDVAMVINASLTSRDA